ncbi:MAG: DUF4350 domain-containing protein [Pseudomonadota bacterium]
MAMLYFLGVGDTGGESSNRNAHASSNGLHGFAGLAQLLEANGYEVEKSRELSGLETLDLLILTPSLWTDADEFAEILENRQYYGPTLVILPKWMVFRPAGEIADVDADRVQDDWVQLGSPTFPSWIEGLPEPYAMRLQLERTEQGVAARWAGLSLSGELPTADSVYAEQTSGQQALVIDPGGRRLAVNVIGEEGSYFYEEAHFVTFVVEPDLMNNYGLANPERAALALALIEQAGYEERSVTFDMTLVGLGESTNLLTLAFRPPFLAATLCLILAMVIVGWRAFLRFGPVADKADEARFGKAQLVRNGAGLIVRAGRLSLLADPYIALTQRKLGRALGLTSPDPDAIDAALRQRLPDEEPYSIRVTRLQNAARAGELVRAAQSLNDLTTKTLGNSRR